MSLASGVFRIIGGLHQPRFRQVSQLRPLQRQLPAVIEILRQTIAIHPFDQRLELPGCKPGGGGVHELAVFTTELRLGSWRHRGVAAGLAQYHVPSIDVSIYVHLGGEGAGVVYRSVNVLASPVFI